PEFLALEYELINQNIDEYKPSNREAFMLAEQQTLSPQLYYLAINKCHGFSTIWEPLANTIQSLKKSCLILPPGIPDVISLSPEERLLLKSKILNSLKLDKECLLLAYSGSIRHFDNEFETFLKAFSLANKSYRRLKLLIFGRDWNSDLSFNLIQKYELKDEAFLLGLLPEKQAFELQQAADILCCPGLNSSFNEKRLPSRLGLFFKFGKPILTHKIGFGESLENYKHALLTETNDYKEWSKKILDLASSEKLRAELSKNSLLVYKKIFNLKRNSSALIKYYKDEIGTPLYQKKTIVLNEDIEPSQNPDKYHLCAIRTAKKLQKMGVSKIAFYGAGYHTKKILESKIMDDFEITAIIDNYQNNKFLNNIPIYHPDSKNLPEWQILLISSDTHEHDMNLEAKKHKLNNISSMYSDILTPIKEVWETI
ncbi:MAG: glycosyltransferase, partial [Lentisphaerales bacterium]|nr:glycosyltransferase [Lentisphaerales bacterium]